MAATTDRARFYLEQYIPELKEYEARGIFSREEIASIAAKRSDFEHTLNARGSTPGDYARYVTYEMNLDALRRKRCKRCGVKGATFNAQRTIFFVLDRATKKFPAELGLWTQYIAFCKKEKANRKLAKVFTNVLRLHPRAWSLWVLAAKHYAETQGDVSTARSYMQRGLRFCKDEKRLWLEYTKLEMVYLAKLAARRRILRLDENSTESVLEEDENMISLPSLKSADLDENIVTTVGHALSYLRERLTSAPAFTGAIPIAIFDAAMQQFQHRSAEVAEDLFHLISTFDALSVTPAILRHILGNLRTFSPTSIETIICEAKYELFSVATQSADFPPALGKALAKIKDGTSNVLGRQSQLAEKALFFVLSLLRYADELDPDVTKVLMSSAKRYLRTISQVPKTAGKQSSLNMLRAKLQLGSCEQDMETLNRLIVEAGLG